MKPADTRIRAHALALALACAALAAMPVARAADDEIMVTDADLAKPGKPELEIHTNFSRGSSVSPGEGVFAPGNMLRLTPEMSIGLSEHWDAGLYLPASVVPGRGLYFDGVKARAKTAYTQPIGQDAHLYYGVQFEVADINPGISPDRTGVEVKAIGGTEFGDWNVGFNVVYQRDVPDHDLYSPAHAVNGKIVRDLGQGMALGLEHYTSWSSVSLEEPVREIDNISFVTFQWKVHDWDLHLGLGHGWSASPDHTVIKLVIGVPID